MAIQTLFVVQAFEMRRKRIVPTTKEQVKDEAQALRCEEARSESEGGLPQARAVALGQIIRASLQSVRSRG